MFDFFLRIILVMSVLAAVSLGHDRTAVSTEITEFQTAECDCGNFLIVSDYESVRAGDSITFDLRSTTERPLPVSIQWSTSAGIIISGQGTLRVTVLTTENLVGPAEQPQKTIPSEEHSYIFSRRRGRVPLTVTASVICDGTHLCPELTKSIPFGMRTIKVNLPADVIGLTLNTDRLVDSCLAGQRPIIPSVSMVIDVTTQAFDADDDPLIYKYTVSGGKIIGNGANVNWDLSGAMPGTYMITGAVDDGCGFCGQTITKVVTVVECTPTCSLIECPSIELNAPNSVANTEVVVFSANVSGGPDVMYEWTVENGQIIDGQGTALVTVRLPLNPSEPNSSVSFKLKGLDPNGFCIEGAKAIYKNGIRVEDPK